MILTEQKSSERKYRKREKGTSFSLNKCLGRFTDHKTRCCEPRNIHAGCCEQKTKGISQSELNQYDQRTFWCGLIGASLRSHQIFRRSSNSLAEDCSVIIKLYVKDAIRLRTTASIVKNLTSLIKREFIPNPLVTPNIASPPPPHRNTVLYKYCKKNINVECYIVRRKFILIQIAIRFPAISR